MRAFAGSFVQPSSSASDDTRRQCTRKLHQSIAPYCHARARASRMRRFQGVRVGCLFETWKSARVCCLHSRMGSQCVRASDFCASASRAGSSPSPLCARSVRSAGAPAVLLRGDLRSCSFVSPSARADSPAAIRHPAAFHPAFTCVFVGNRDTRPHTLRFRIPSLCPLSDRQPSTATATRAWITALAARRVVEMHSIPA